MAGQVGLLAFSLPHIKMGQRKNAVILEAGCQAKNHHLELYLYNNIMHLDTKIFHGPDIRDRATVSL